MNKIEELIKELCPDGVKFKEIREVCISLKKGTLKQTELQKDSKYPVINSGRDWYGYYNSYNNDSNAIVIASRGEYAGFVTYIDKKFWAGGLCYPYRSLNENYVLTKFIYYILKKNEHYIMDKLVARSSIPALNKTDIDKFKIPIPPIQIQDEIVSILDKFTELEMELEKELKKELEARSNQYEYYINNLLSFKNIADLKEL